MTTPEDIPEDREESFPCDDCGGNITLHDGVWHCDGCGFEEEDEMSNDDEDNAVIRCAEIWNIDTQG